MLWLFELMFMMFILMFAETSRIKKEIALEQYRYDIILKLEDAMREHDREFRKIIELDNKIPYRIPELKPNHSDKKKVDKSN